MVASRQFDSSGGLAEQIGRSDFLKLQALVRTRSLLDEEGRLIYKVPRILLAVPFLIYELALRVLLAAVTLLAAVLKAVFILVCELLWGLIKPIDYFWIKRERTFQQWRGRWAGETRIGKWTFFERVRPGILGFESRAALPLQKLQHPQALWSRTSTKKLWPKKDWAS